MTPRCTFRLDRGGSHLRSEAANLKSPRKLRAPDGHASTSFAIRVFVRRRWRSRQASTSLMGRADSIACTRRPMNENWYRSPDVTPFVVPYGAQKVSESKLRLLCSTLVILLAIFLYLGYYAARIARSLRQAGQISGRRPAWSRSKARGLLSRGTAPVGMTEARSTKPGSGNSGNSGNTPRRHRADMVRDLHVDPRASTGHFPPPWWIVRLHEVREAS